MSGGGGLSAIRAAVIALAVALAAALLAPTPALAAQSRFPSAHAAVAHCGPAARKRIAPAFRSAGVAYPPSRVVLAAIKDERVLQIYAARKGALRHITTYRILGTSGHAGPKLREGDRQIPEGVYRIPALSTNTAFHLAMPLNYPNAFDRAQAKGDRRDNLGGGILIHGGDRSTGCLAMGDEVAEDLFVLVADTGLSRVKVVIAPTDPRASALRPRAGSPEWVPALYRTISREFAELPAPPKPVAVGRPAAGAAATSSAGASGALAYGAGSDGQGLRVGAVWYGGLGGSLVAVSGLAWWVWRSRRRIGSLRARSRR